MKKTLLKTFLILLIIVFASVISLKIPTVQEWSAKKIVEWISKDLGSNIGIEKAYIKSLNNIQLKKIYIDDKSGNKILFADSLNLNIRLLPLLSKKLIINYIEINNAKFNLKHLATKKEFNLQFLIDYISSSNADAKDKINIINIKKVKLDNIQFNFENSNGQNFTNVNVSNNINYNDIQISNLNLLAHDILINTSANNLTAIIDSLSLKEKSGFSINKLQANLLYTEKKIEFKNFLLVTPNSYITNYVSFSYNKIDDFKDFLDKVSLKVNFINSKVSFTDIAFFAFPINGNSLALEKINGLVSGPINNLKTKRLVVHSHNAILDSSIDLRGIPDIKNSFVNLNINKFSISKNDVSKILLDISKSLKPYLPKELDKFHQTSLSGKITGKLLSFNTNGIISTKPGDLAININTDIFPNEASFTYSGQVQSNNLDIGYILDSEEFNNAKFTSTITGKDISKNHAILNANVHLSRINFNNYGYKNIYILGSYDKGITNIKTNVKDNNVQLQAKLFLNSINKNFHINTYIQNANIKVLNFYNGKDIYLSAQIQSNLKYSKLNINSSFGDIKINKLYIGPRPYISEDDNNNIINDINISIADYSDTGKSLNLTSPIIDFSIKGKYTLDNIYKTVYQAYNYHIYPEQNFYSSNYANFNFSAKTKDIKYITEIFYPDLMIAENTTIKGNIDTEQKLFNFKLSSDGISYKKNILSDIVISQTSNYNSLNINMQSNSLRLNDIPMSDLQTNISIKGYQANAHVDIINKDHNDQIHLNTLINFNRYGFALSFIDSKIKIGDTNWNFNKESSIIKFKNKIIINNILLTSNEQRIICNGILSDNINDVLNIELTNVDIYKLTLIPNILNINVKGIITGKASIASFSHLPKVNSNFTILELNYNNINLGNGTFTSSWDPIEKKILLSGYIKQEGKTLASLKGQIIPNDEANIINALLKLEGYPAYALGTLIPGEISEVKGNITGSLIIHGIVLNPNIVGSINFDNVEFKINALNTKYTINETIELKEGSVIFNNNKLIDVNGNEAFINGFVRLKSDITNPIVNLNINVNNFVIISPDVKQNYNFYGSVIATGHLQIIGSIKNLQIKGEIETNKGSNLTVVVPVKVKANSSLVSFVPFYKNIKKQSTILDTQNSNKLSVKIIANINNNAEIILLLDPITNEFINVKGQGGITINYNTIDSNIQLYGLYTINSGLYNFTSGIISKIFNLAPKSTVSFSGNPINTVINIKAIYSLYTPLDNLYKEVKISPESIINNNRSVKVNTIIHIQGKIKDLEPNFTIDFPNDSQLSSEIFSSYLSNKDNVTKQVISLIMTGNFIAGNLNTNTLNQFIADALYSTGADLLFQQIKNVFNTLLNIENVNFNAKITSYSQEIGSNINLYNNRLIITGNIIAGNRPSASGKDQSLKRNIRGITGNIEAVYLVNKSGTISIKAFNRTNDYLTSLSFNENLYSQGIGISYTRDFNSILDLFKK